LVALLVSVTVAPGSTAPLESWTVPRTVDVVDVWANVGATEAIRISRLARTHPSVPD
jgi:hypothetical protein